MLLLGMDKAELLASLAKARSNVGQANLDIITQTHRVGSLKRKGMDAAGASIILRGFVNDEQKLLRKLDWLLDQLDQLEAPRPT